MLVWPQVECVVPPNYDGFAHCHSILGQHNYKKKFMAGGGVCGTVSLLVVLKFEGGA